MLVPRRIHTWFHYWQYLFHDWYFLNDRVDILFFWYAHSFVCFVGWLSTHLSKVLLGIIVWEAIFVISSSKYFFQRNFGAKNNNSFNFNWTAILKDKKHCHFFCGWFGVKKNRDAFNRHSCEHHIIAQNAPRLLPKYWCWKRGMNYQARSVPFHGVGMRQRVGGVS